MKYEIRENAQYSNREIYFDGKPDEQTRARLKALRMRWHGQKMCWYGFATVEQIEQAIKGDSPIENAESPKAKNKFGVQVGDIFEATWGYDQTNVDFFQVVELVGALSVRVRQVHPPIIQEDATGPMSADYKYQITREILPPAPHSVFIKDQERGDVKRLKSYHKDGKHPQFRLDSFADAHLIETGTYKTYESWYA